MTPLTAKSTVDEIRARFDADVERFAQLETGQASTIDAPLMMELITQAALAATPHPRCVLDLGCGAGNNSIRLLRGHAFPIEFHLVDLSLPMLERAAERLSQEKTSGVRTFQGDLRTLPLPEASYDIVIAAAVLHHLRDDADWELVFGKLYRWLRPGGSVWISDLVAQETGPIHDLMWRRYGDYLEQPGGREYREQVMAYVDKEDSPRSLTYQLDLLRRVGFVSVEVLHKNSCFAAFGAIKAGSA